jgi:hypothetical protein
MSADRWSECPKCHKNESGSEISPLEDNDVERNLREDYEVWLDDGVFTVDYRCECYACHFKFKYHYVEELVV